MESGVTVGKGRLLNGNLAEISSSVSLESSLSHGVGDPVGVAKVWVMMGTRLLDILSPSRLRATGSSACKITITFMIECC